MRLLTAVTACLLAPFAFRAAFAAPNRLDLLRQTVENRPEDGLTKAQLKALAKADKLLGKTPTNTAGEVAAAISVVKLLDKAFPGDAQFAFVLDNAIPDILGDVTADHDALATLLAALPDDKRKTKAQTALAAAETSVDAIAAAGDRPTKLGLLKAAVASIGKGFNAVAKRQSYLIATLDDGSGPRRIAVTRLLVIGLSEPASGALEVEVVGFPGKRQDIGVILYPVTGTGTFPLQSDGGVFTTSNAGLYENGAGYATTDGSPGTATITRYDGRRAFDATFSFVAEHYVSGNTVTVTDGLLRIR
jgi:hypothetical protein